jgi:putative membrane-bound dehydrogenase-like protein
MTSRSPRARTDRRREGAGGSRRIVPLLAGILGMLITAGGFVAAAADTFPEPHDTEQRAGSPLPAAEAAARFDVPPGFSVSVFAAEPDVGTPIAMAWDRRGRLWVAENFTYAEAATRFDDTLRDRVVILEDLDGDGVAERRTVFTDAVRMLTGIEVGRGGVWLICPPQLLFIPDRDADDVPDGPVEVVLDGFDVTGPSYHNFANGLRFGPDGWLYGRCGHSCPARIGRPGTPADRRLPMEGGLWRFHPDTGAIEVLTTGTTNPWGHDWTAEGECFFVNTVNGHLWHMIPGAHFAQANGIDPNPLTYELIDQHADHYHFDTGAGWQASRHGAADALGGGHAHSGCMIYAGTNWPPEWRGRLFTLNFHGRRVNQEVLARSGSGYVARHAPDLFASGDPWFRGIELAAGPDGGVVVLDWSDVGECHERDGVHRSSGRVFRLAHGTPHRPPHRDLDAIDDRTLALLLREPDGWHAAHAAHALADRVAVRPIDAEALGLLESQLAEADRISAATATPDGHTVGGSALRVRALLALHRIHARRGSADDASGVAVDAWHDRLVALIGAADASRRSPEAEAADDEHVRTWAVRLLTESWPLDAALGPAWVDEATRQQVTRESRDLLPVLVRLAERDPSGLVRLALGSTLQRLPVAERPRLAAALVARDDDAGDHNLPLLVWYGLIPVAEAAPEALADVAAACAWPTTRRLIARRLAERIVDAPAALSRLLDDAATAVRDPGRNPDSAAQLADTLAGVAAGLAGWRRAPEPATWTAVTDAVAALPESRDRERCRTLVRDLAVLFGDGRALDRVRATALDPKAPLAAREAALRTLIEARPAELRDVCDALLGVRYLAVPAARGLATFADDEAAARLVDACRRTHPAQRGEIVSLLVSRASFARRLLDAIAAGRITASDLTAFHVRQIHALGDAALSTRVDTLWGRLRDTPAAKRERVTALAAALDTDTLATADLGRGRRLYDRTCGGCHRLYGVGGELGPDLTGSGRHDLGYLLENIVDPGAVVNRDWRLSVVTLADGRVLSGVVTEARERTVTLATPTERLVLDRDDIESITPTDASPMPDGLLDPLLPAEIRDLIAYLRHPVQVPLP